MPVRLFNTLSINLYSHLLLGLSSYVGSARGKQDSTGAVLAHIKDLTVSHAHEQGGIGASVYTTDKQVFHTDLGDLIALMAIQTAAKGGVSRISSAGKVYNDIAATRPDLIHTLAEPWPIDRCVSCVCLPEVTLIQTALVDLPDIRRAHSSITKTDIL